MLMCGTDALQIVCAKECSAGTYLNIPRIIAAAEVADVQAIHPGYGFLSENPHFAEVCRACNFEFVSTISKRRKLIATLLLS